VASNCLRFFESRLVGLSPRSHNNFLRTIRTFLGFAQNHGWLSKETDLLARVEKRSEKPTPVEIFTANQLAALLKHASPEFAPCLALGAFAGLRSKEILPLDWSDVERRPGFIEVAAHKAKTAARRIVPISDNLARWLAIARATGRAYGHRAKIVSFTPCVTRLRTQRSSGNKMRSGIPSFRTGSRRFKTSTALHWKQATRRR
jgi:integrase